MEKEVTRGLCPQVTRTAEEPGFRPLPARRGLLLLSTRAQKGGCGTRRMEAVLFISSNSFSFIHFTRGFSLSIAVSCRVTVLSCP